MNKTMIKRLMYSIMVLTSTVLLLASCQQDDAWKNAQPEKEGYVRLTFSADIPEMQEVSTRAVDPDGGGVQDMTLFCFDRYGLFITTMTAKLKTTEAQKGNFTALVPDHTRTIHFVANQVMTNFPQDHFRNKSEAETMALLEGSSGRMIYWARFACRTDNNQNIAEQLKTEANNTIRLLRNHAKVSVQNPTNNYFTVKSLAVYNTNAFGTVAPFHPTKGFNFTAEDWKKDKFVTLPEDKSKLSDVTDVTSSMGRYIFECENSVDDPVSAILYGRNQGEEKDLYYRVMLVDDNDEQIPIRRNHDYQINIRGPLSFGQETFEAAVEAPATNNIWVSISDRVNSVEDGTHILTVDQTFHIIDDSNGEQPFTISYELKKQDGSDIPDNEKPEVMWLDNQVAAQKIVNEFNRPEKGKGTIIISPLAMGNNEKLEGTLLVKKGHLQRKVKVISVKKQSFVPSWVGTQVYGGMDEDDPTKNRSHVTVMFTVPETCPAELFPLKTYISVAGLDIRNASGMALTVVRNGEKDWYNSGDIKEEPDYKYLYIVKKPGVQRVYFENILSQEDQHISTLYIEAEHFKTMDRNFTYSNDYKSITVEDLSVYNAQGGGSEDAADDELVHYRLVPQKRYAHVQFKLQLRDKINGNELNNSGSPFNAGEKDEFLLYSQFLDFFTDEEVKEAGVEQFDCIFYPEKSETWWKKHNPNAGRMLMFKPREKFTPTETGKYNIYLKTNRPQSTEVIRIASNFKTKEAILESDAGENGLYGGDSYRCATFELTNYNPFRFGSRVTYNNKEHGKEPDRTSNPIADVPELITPMEWTYEPGKEVTIAFDVTSFKGSDDKSVDPFGESFEIYIDAPMLELGQNDLPTDKLYEDPNKPGRYIYKVDANREKERNVFPNSEVINKDETANQTGERKTLYFKTKEIVSAGDIVLSSNTEKVVFYSKTFRISNQSMTGQIVYKTSKGDTEERVVPKDAFVAFERVSNSNRIGAVNITANGTFQLRLRKEYKFDWDTNPVQFHYETNGTVYHAKFESLSELFKNLNNQNKVTLTPEETPEVNP